MRATAQHYYMIQLDEFIVLFNSGLSLTKATSQNILDITRSQTVPLVIPAEYMRFATGMNIVIYCSVVDIGVSYGCTLSDTHLLDLPELDNE